MNTVNLPTVRVPSIYKDVVEDPNSLVAVEHCDVLKTRIPQTLLALCLSSVMDHHHVTVHTDDPDALRFKLEEWVEKAGLKIRRRSGGAFRFAEDHFLWIFGHNDRAASHDVGLVVIVNAHRMEEEQVRRLTIARGRRAYLTGIFCERTHWFYKWCRKPEVSLHRFSAEKVVAHWTNEREEFNLSAARMDRMTYRRTMMLEDIDLTRHFASFRKFAKDRLVIRDKTSSIVNFNLTPVQQRYLAMKRMYRMQGFNRFLVLKSRREGITTLEQGLTYQDTVCRSNRMNVTLAHLAESTSRIFRIAKLMHERDPYGPELKGVGNATRLEFPTLNSLFFIGTAGSVGFGRGDTLQRVHGSEVSKWCRGPQQMEKVADLIAGLTEAASHGEVVLETTASGVEWFYHQWCDAKKKLNSWAPIFLPWFLSPFNRVAAGNFSAEEIRDTLSDEEKELIAKHDLDLGQIAWRRAKMLELKGLFRQEYPEDDITCFLTSGTLYFDYDALDQLISEAPAPVREEFVPGGTIKFWEEPIPGELYVAGGDTSEGLPGCDENGTLVVHQPTGRHVAQAYGLMPIDVQAAVAVKLSRMYNGALLGIERNNTSGGAVVAKVQQLGYDHQFEFREGRLGFSTDAITRPVMLNELRDLFNASLGLRNIRSTEVLSQSMTFKLQSDGKFAGDPGTKDDAVLMAAITNFLRQQASLRPGITVD